MGEKRTGGGANIEGDADTGGGDLTGRDRQNVNVRIDGRPNTSRGYLNDIWEFERKAADMRSWMITGQVTTILSMVALIIVLWVIGVTFASTVNHRFAEIDAQFDSIERRLNTIDNRIQRIATPEPLREGD